MSEKPQLPTPTKLDPDDQPEKPRGQGWAARGANLICPGFGQYLERRFIAGTFFLVMALTGFGMFAAPLIGWYAAYIRVLANEVEGSTLASFPWQHLVGGILLVLTSYVWSFLDAGRQ